MSLLYWEKRSFHLQYLNVFMSLKLSKNVFLFQIHIDIPRMNPEALILQPKVTEASTVVRS